MSDNVPITPGTGAVIATDDVAGVQYQKIKIDVGGDGVSLPLSPANPMPVAGNLTITNFPADAALTNDQLRATALPVSVSGGATAAKQDTGNTSLASIDTKTPVLVGGAVPVAGPLTDAQLRATSLPLPTGAATAAKQDVGNTSLASVDGKLPALVGGAMPVGLAAPTNVTTTAYAKSLVLKTAPGILFGLSGYNSKATEQFIQLHDATAEPTGTTAVPKVVVKVAASSPFALDFGPRGRAFATGIVVCNSSTGPTAAVGAADCWFDGQVG